MKVNTDEMIRIEDGRVYTSKDKEVKGNAKK